MKIFILSDSYAPHTRRWVNWFSERGHDVYLISFHDKILPNYSSKIKEIIVLRPRFLKNEILTKIFKVPFILIGLLRAYIKIKPDVIHSHTSGGYAWAPFILGLPNRIITPWGTDILVDIFNSKINYFFTKLSLKAAQFVTTDAEFFKLKLHALGVKNDKIYVHNFGTDVNKFKSKEKLIEEGSEYITVISTRTPNPVHDVMCFVLAIPYVLKEFNNIRFILVGDGTELSMLKNKVSELGVNQYVSFTGMVEEDRMIDLLDNASIYVSTSSMDAGLSASTAEAMSLSKPVISTDNSDNKLWIHEGKGGWLFENSNSEELANAILKLIQNPKDIELFGKYNRDLIVEKYNTDVELEYIETLYLSKTIPARG